MPRGRSRAVTASRSLPAEGAAPPGPGRRAAWRHGVGREVGAEGRTPAGVLLQALALGLQALQGRLNYTAGPWGQEEYAYDAAGNRIGDYLTVGGTTTSHNEITWGTANRLEHPG